MSKKNVTAPVSSPAIVEVAPMTRTFNGRSFARHAPSKIDGFLFTGGKDAPVQGSFVGKLLAVVAGKPSKASPDKPNAFLVFEAHGATGDLALKVQGEEDPEEPETWAGLHVGVSQGAALDSLARDASNIGRTMMLVYGAYKKNAKSGRTFRDIEVYFADDDGDDGASE